MNVFAKHSSVLRSVIKVAEFTPKVEDKKRLLD